MAEIGRLWRERRHRYAATIGITLFTTLIGSSILQFLSWEPGSMEWLYLAVLLMLGLAALIFADWRTGIIGFYRDERSPEALSAPTPERSPEPLARKMCPLTVRQLFDLMRGKTDLQAKELVKPHHGTWMELEGTVSNVDDSFGEGVSINVDGVDGKDASAVFRIQSKKFHNYSLSLRKGDQVALRGKLSSVSLSPLKDDGGLVQLKEAEIIPGKAMPEPAAEFIAKKAPTIRAQLERQLGISNATEAQFIGQPIAFDGEVLEVRESLWVAVRTGKEEVSVSASNDPTFLQSLRRGDSVSVEGTIRSLIRDHSDHIFVEGVIRRPGNTP